MNIHGQNLMTSSNHNNNNCNTTTTNGDNNTNTNNSSSMLSTMTSSRKHQHQQYDHRDHLTHKQLLIPELCFRHTFPASGRSGSGAGCRRGRRKQNYHVQKLSETVNTIELSDSKKNKTKSKGHEDRQNDVNVSSDDGIGNEDDDGDSDGDGDDGDYRVQQDGAASVFTKGHLNHTSNVPLCGQFGSLNPNLESLLQETKVIELNSSDMNQLNNDDDDDEDGLNDIKDVPFVLFETRQLDVLLVAVSDTVVHSKTRKHHPFLSINLIALIYTEILSQESHLSLSG
ncbi:unnamed protein product [Trichobilharzia regenti]|nr:unnamed protein product [Trichobilharzia regenti]